jgi:hypothetical protein
VATVAVRNTDSNPAELVSGRFSGAFRRLLRRAIVAVHRLVGHSAFFLRPRDFA